MTITITDVIARDIRFPTSKSFAGSDAMNPDPDYSAAYVVLHTNSPDGLQGHGLTFTIGRWTEICVTAINALKPLVSIPLVSIMKQHPALYQTVDTREQADGC